ncbi:hypothetical protein THRCLA_11609 [Thraustotheca clavata]|uniref:Myb-like domain-containing protein n=1 Tax=Thraustotheca clavata TaxID=74557 RepID=A0A1V9Y769_9STRA|nr:hypothetical protein THRCLA_11609 [Thraustotheca clavata]
MIMATNNPSSLASVPPNMKLLDLATTKTNSTNKTKNTSESADSDSTQPTATNQTTSGRKYERRTKRFIWPDELHRLFVAAVFDVGLKNASPKALLTLMGNPATSSGLTTEHLKSHLQKYRLNYDRSRVEFLKFFDESVAESAKAQKRKGKNVQQGSISALFPICPTSKKRKTSDDGEDDGSSEDEEDEKVAKVVATTQNITRQLDVQAKTLHMQAQFQEEIQQQLYEQALLQRQLQERLSQVTMAKGITENALNAARAASRNTSNTHLPPHPTSQHKPVNTTNHRQQPTSSTNQFQHHLTALSQLGPSADPNDNLQWNLGLLQQSSAHSSPFTVSPSSRVASNSTVAPSAAPTMSLEQQNASHLQMQMAMQQQMYLHRQMLLRKVEVSQQQGLNSQLIQDQPSWNSNASAAPASRPPLTIDPPAAEWTPEEPPKVASPSLQMADVSKPASPSTDDMDLYGWDKLNLDVDMNDDLFSFLK